MDCIDLKIERETISSEISQTADVPLTTQHSAKQYKVNLRGIRFYEIALLPNGQIMAPAPRHIYCKVLLALLTGSRSKFSRTLIGSLFIEKGGSIEDTLSAKQILDQLDAHERHRDEVDKRISELRIAHEKMRLPDKQEA